jgi:hypothetical protein
MPDTARRRTAGLNVLVLGLKWQGGTISHPPENLIPAGDGAPAGKSRAGQGAGERAADWLEASWTWMP